MRLAIVADTHMPRGTRRLPNRCLDELRAADLIVHAGDFSEESVLADLRELGPLVAVHGNVDSAELRRELPESVTFEIEGATLAVVHDAGPATGRLERLRSRFPEADAVVFGHSHQPVHEEREGFQIFNPGSPTERRRAPARTMGRGQASSGGISFELIELG